MISLLCLCYIPVSYTVGAKKMFTFRLRRTVENAPYRFRCTVNRSAERYLHGQRTVSYTVKVRSRNGNGTEVFS